MIKRDKKYMKKFSLLNPQGFTLIELIVVVGILGILAATLLAAINPVAQFNKSNDAKRKGDLETVQRALELYYQDNGSYPLSLNWGNPWTPYISKLPKDPVSTYNYVYFSTGQTYYLYAHLQQSSDPQACNSGSACSGFSKGISGFPSSGACGSSTGGAVCNYGVTSSDVSP